MLHAGYSPDAVSYTTLITALSWLGRSADALEAFKELDASPNAQVDLYAYNAVISALSVAGRMTDARSYLQRAAQLAQDQAAPAPVEAFGAIIKVCYSEAKHALEFYVQHACKLVCLLLAGCCCFTGILWSPASKGLLTNVQPCLPAAALPGTLWTHVCFGCGHMQKVLYLYGTRALLIAVRVIMFYPKVLCSMCGVPPPTGS